MNFLRISSIPGGASLLLSSLLTLGSCNEQPRHPASTAPKSAAPAPVSSPTTASADTTEYLDWAAARINGRLPLQGPVAAAWQELGRPDSLVVPNPNNECSSFFGRVHQEAYVGDTEVVRSLDMRLLALHVGSLHLTHRTTLAEFRKVFPQAGREQSTLHDDALGEVTAINLAIAAQPTDDSWRILFKNGQLVRIDYFVPC